MRTHHDHHRGIDIGSGVVKTALFRTEGGNSEWLAKRFERIRRRDQMQLAQDGYDDVLEEAGSNPPTSTTSPPPAKARTSNSPPGTSTR